MVFQNPICKPFTGLECFYENYDENYNNAKNDVEETLSFQSSYCSCCGHKAKLPLKCSKCMSVHYCNVVCQRKHWKNGHKQECKKVE